MFSSFLFRLFYIKVSYRQTDIHTDRQIGRLIDIDAERQTVNQQTDRQTVRQTENRHTVRKTD